MPICDWAPTTLHGPLRRTSVFRTTTDRSRTRRCAAWAWAHAARRKGGAMCPSYMATREEKHSTRGRAHLLWELLQGEVLEGGWQNEEVKDALDLCLSCKACKTECPTNVDLATYKAEFLSHYYEGRSRPLAAYAFGLIDRWARLASHTPRLANALGSFPLTAGLAKSAAAHRAAAHAFPSSRRPPSGHASRDEPEPEPEPAQVPGSGRREPTCSTVGRHLHQLLPAPYRRGGVSRAVGRGLQRQGACSVMCAAGGRCTTSACSTRRSST